MTTDTTSAVFEDFNEPRDEPATLPDDDLSLAAEIGELRQTAWTEGYLAGRQQSNLLDGEPPLTARLLTSVHELASQTSDAVNTASLVVADLLVNTVIAATSEGWATQLLERVRTVADRIRPALTVTPEYVLRDEHGTEQCFGDISDLSRALEAGTGEDVTIRWQRGEATISRTAWLADLREAFVPLSAARASAQAIRSPT